MKFLCDQNVERRFANWLKSIGHDVTVVAVDYPAGIPDTEVLALAFRVASTDVVEFRHP